MRIRIHNTANKYQVSPFVTSVEKLKAGKAKRGEEREQLSAKQKVIHLQIRRLHLKIQG